MEIKDENLDKETQESTNDQTQEVDTVETESDEVENLINPDEKGGDKEDIDPYSIDGQYEYIKTLLKQLENNKSLHEKEVERRKEVESILNQMSENIEKTQQEKDKEVNERIQELQRQLDQERAEKERIKFESNASKHGVVDLDFAEYKLKQKLRELEQNEEDNANFKLDDFFSEIKEKHPAAFGISVPKVEDEPKPKEKVNTGLGIKGSGSASETREGVAPDVPLNQLMKDFESYKNKYKK